MLKVTQPSHDAAARIETKAPTPFHFREHSRGNFLKTTECFTPGSVVVGGLKLDLKWVVQHEVTVLDPTGKG